MYLSGYEAVGIYTNILAFILTLALITLSQRLISARHSEDKLFLFMTIPVILGAICGISYHLATVLHPSFAHGMALLAVSGGSFFAVTDLVIWVLYVDYKCNGSKDRLKRRYSFLAVLWGAYFLLLVVNAFTGSVFIIDENLDFQGRILYRVLVMISLFLFLLSCGIFVYYRDKTNRGKMFRISPVIVPVSVSIIAEQTLFDSIEPLGFAVALIFLYFSLIESWQYDTGESGVYNQAYLSRLAEEINSGEKDIKSVIVIEAENVIGSTFLDLLKTELPADADLVQVSEKKYVFFTSKKSKKALNAMCMILEADGEEYDEQHPDEPLHISCPCIIRDEEDAVTWVEKVCS